MRSVVYDRHGDPGQVLRLETEDAPPTPRPGEVLVRVLARPLHPGDLAGVVGFGANAGPLDQPRSPGLEGMGIVEELGEGVSGPEPGSRVAFFPVPGALREYVTFPAHFAVPVPDGVSDATAAVMLVNTITMRDLLRAVEDTWAGKPRPVLQSAAGSSVARLVTAVAAGKGYPLVNLVRTGQGAEVLRERFPSVPVITSSDPGWAGKAHAALGGPAGVILDPVGGTLAAQLLGLLEDGGTLITYGALSGEGMPLGPGTLMGRELRMRGVAIGRWASARTAEQRAGDIEFAAELALTRPQLLDVAAVYDLAGYRAAVAEVTRPGKVGTVVLTSPVAGAEGST